MQAFASLNISCSWDYCGTVPALNVRVGNGGTIRHITTTRVSVLGRASGIIPQFVNRGARNSDFGSLKCKTRTMDTWIISAVDQILYTFVSTTTTNVCRCCIVHFPSGVVTVRRLQASVSLNQIVLQYRYTFVNIKMSFKHCIVRNNYNFVYCFVWVWNLVSHIEGGTWTEGVVENIWG
jgi:hypothetical protein